MVRTRFAPSPTGYLHIGGVRTALFCWLYARQHGGQFILRIDDTDQERNVAEALSPILEGLRWLGIDWDEGPDVGGPHAPYYQSQRADRYQVAVEQLLAGGHAYRDYATPVEVQAERDAALAEKQSFVYSRRFMAQTAADQARFESQGRQSVVRLKMPRQGALVINDLIRGQVEFQWEQEQDHVIQRADGACLYHLANVVDDHDFQITHVIRAEEHLSNTPRQIFMLQALGYALPQYAHLPFVAEPGSKTKLSKRKLDKYLKNRDFAALLEHGRKIAQAIGHTVEADSFNPVIVDFYKTVGYVPEAIINYLALLGWSLDDKTEDFTRDDLIKFFSLERVNKAPASFDPKKLMAFEERHFQTVPLDEMVPIMIPYLQKAGYLVSNPTSKEISKVKAVIQAAGDRIKVAGDILFFPEFFLKDEDLYKLPFEPGIREKVLSKSGTVELLKKWCEIIPTIKPFDAATIEKQLRDFVASEGIKIGDLIHPLRVALTHKAKGLGVYDTAAILRPDINVALIKSFISEKDSSP